MDLGIHFSIFCNNLHRHKLLVLTQNLEILSLGHLILI